MNAVMSDGRWSWTLPCRLNAGLWLRRWFPIQMMRASLCVQVRVSLRTSLAGSMSTFIHINIHVDIHHIMRRKLETFSTGHAHALNVKTWFMES